MDKEPTEKQIEQLTSGVTITTSVQRDSGKKDITAKTMPCKVISFANTKHFNNHYIRGLKGNSRSATSFKVCNS